MGRGSRYGNPKPFASDPVLRQFLTDQDRDWITRRCDRCGHHPDVHDETGCTCLIQLSKRPKDGFRQCPCCLPPEKCERKPKT